MESWDEFKFEYACCCVTIQSLTLGPSHKSTQSPSCTVFRLRPWEKVTSSQCYGDGVRVRPSQEGRTSHAPQLPWRSRGFLFFPVGCFWKSHDVFMPHPKIKGPSWYWPSKSHKQGPSLVRNVKMNQWKCLNPPNGNDEYIEVSIIVKCFYSNWNFNIFIVPTWGIQTFSSIHLNISNETWALLVRLTWPINSPPLILG